MIAICFGYNKRSVILKTNAKLLTVTPLHFASNHGNLMGLHPRVLIIGD